MSILRLPLLLLVIVMIGCSTRESPVRRVNPPGPRIMKAALEEIVATGKLGDSVHVVKRELDAMVEGNTKLAKSLEPDYKQLISLKDPAAIKAKAKEMVDRL